MTIAILPARLANQIAAGEVVERPASVIKELIENSLDAGATNINVEVEKGGIKKIRISDNGRGIIKDELTLALSRHATSKIKDLSDLEAINSLGFRGEALASISSVARLTLTSKPKEQATAWQANAEGRNMEVTIKPAAHPDGTSIEVLDLFFNTPARRKFLRTEKTEFNHIYEVVRRIALARFDVSFNLTHNGKMVRQYRLATTKAQFNKRVAMICGQKFIEHAVEVDCHHDNMTLSGWLANPSFSRNQNDLCYGYVNGRMMRDKLINHAIRQAYSDLLPSDTYPAFVLFLELDNKDVDVNVHPAKHEVRFHQSRYVHDFIFSVCNEALQPDKRFELGDEILGTSMDLAPEQTCTQQKHSVATQSISQPAALNHQCNDSDNNQKADYITPIKYTNDIKSTCERNGSITQRHFNQTSVSPVEINNYEKLITPFTEQAFWENNNIEGNVNHLSSNTYVSFFLTIQSPGYAVFKHGQGLRLLSLFKLAQAVNFKIVEQSWLQEPLGLVSQPLLLPVVISLAEQQVSLVKKQQEWLNLAGIVFVIQDKNRLQIRQFPAILRNKDVSASFISIVDSLLVGSDAEKSNSLREIDYYQALATALRVDEYGQEQAEYLLSAAKKYFKEQLSVKLHLNSIPVDLTSHIKQLQ